eukprot:TRINITY_DN2612_c0_g1_i2.p1 TRINITY_DN2612_c0_g1~~TRINITY_DN2612_c0_g1_i2.p1  ORF type:complete len:402 (+),score=86.61 TRINITY_DN2612_c0_g1_i2:113-1318(+)
MTSLSLSAIATNGRVKAGGTYYMISRALGASLGGSCGTLFAIATALASAMYILGSVEAILSFFPSTPSGIDLSLLSSLIGFGVLILLTLVVVGGIDLVAKVGTPALAAVFISIIGTLVGLLIRSGSSNHWEANWESNYSPGVSFALMIGIFFPSVTGISAGSNRSGALKSPSKSIPVGTTMAILFTTTIYLVHAWLYGLAVDRPSLLVEGEKIVAAEVAFPVPQMVQVGILLSSIGAGLQSIVSASSLLQAIIADKIFKLPDFMQQTGERLRMMCVAIVFVISFCGVASGSLNFLAPIITQLFMITYAFVNASCALLSFLNDPSWRPGFKYFSKWTALIGVLYTLALMIFIDWVFALAACVAVWILYAVIEGQDARKNWGDATTGVSGRLCEKECGREWEE